MKMTMKLKNKLILTFCIMSILPMVLCGLVICGMYKIHAQNMYQTYEIDSQTFLIDFYSPMELMGKITENIYDDIREIAEENPEKFNDEAIWSILITDCQRSSQSWLSVRTVSIHISQRCLKEKILMSCFRHMMKMRTFVMWHFIRAATTRHW